MRYDSHELSLLLKAAGCWGSLPLCRVRFDASCCNLRSQNEVRVTHSVAGVNFMGRVFLSAAAY